MFMQAALVGIDPGSSKESGKRIPEAWAGLGIMMCDKHTLGLLILFIEAL